MVEIVAYRPEQRQALLDLSLRAWAPVFPLMEQDVPAFVYRSFYQMRTGVELSSVAADVAGQVAVAEQAADGLVAPPIPDREAKRGI